MNVVLSDKRLHSFLCHYHHDSQSSQYAHNCKNTIYTIQSTTNPLFCLHSIKQSDFGHSILPFSTELLERRGWKERLFLLTSMSTKELALRIVKDQFGVLAEVVLTGSR